MSASLLHRSLTDRAREIWEGIEFVSPDDLYNKQAPDPIVAFIIGGVLSFFTLLYWYLKRWQGVRKEMKDTSTSKLLNIRTLIASFSDNDDPVFTIIRLTSQSMLFLGGFQINYQRAFYGMLVYFAVLSISDTVRILLALRETDSLKDLVLVSKRDKALLLAEVKKHKNGKIYSTVINSGNVYENISRNFLVVTMVFITQVILIAFVCVDIHDNDLMSAYDGTPDVPIVGTLGSWLIYVLGIFMQCVYILGPKQSFGSSEQNPTFWLQLLLVAKKTGAKCKYYSAADDEEKIIDLRPNDPMIWLRFCMSFLVNGLGFHILVHALPVQVASQSTLTGIVFRAVGMMYLVDLDDSPAVGLTLYEEPPSMANIDTTVSNISDGEKVELAPHNSDTEMEGVAPKNISGHETEQAISKTAQQLIAEAQKKAEDLQAQLKKDLEDLQIRHAFAEKGQDEREEDNYEGQGNH